MNPTPTTPVYNEGVAAFCNQQTVMSCPYQRGTWQFEEWMDGFNDAKKELA